jgi:hypothetical protein
MIIDKELAIEDFKNFLDFPILGKALYFKMQEYKAAIAADIKEFKDIVELRRLVKKNADKWPKTSNDLDIKFEIVNTSGIWITVLPDEQDCEPSRIIPGELVYYIVREVAKMDYGYIKRENNLTLPGINGKVFNIWFEKITDDYIFGIIKPTKFETGSNDKTNIDQIINDLKNVDYDKMFEIFWLMFEDEYFRAEVYHVLRIWKTVMEKGKQAL